jgi:hypothetical protein
MAADSLTAPDGTMTADSYLTNAGNGRIVNSIGLPAGSIVSGTQYTMSVYAKNISGSGQFFMYCGNASVYSSPILTATASWQRFTWTFTANATGNDVRIVQVPAAGDLIAVWGAQINRGPAALPYQSVPGDGSTYTSTGITPFQLYDGTDDSQATASFAAGTLINGMDCMIAVRRDAAVLPSVCGLYQLDQTKFFGVVGEEPSNSTSTFGNCGSPTIFVDGVSVANTRGALHSAIGVGDWHILEYRDLDLSAWVSAGFGSYGSPYMLNGDQGGILLFPSSTSTADRDAARTWLGAKVGLTL